MLIPTDFLLTLKNLRVIKDFRVFKVLNDPKNSKDLKDPIKF